MASYLCQLQTTLDRVFSCEYLVKKSMSLIANKSNLVDGGPCQSWQQSSFSRRHATSTRLWHFFGGLSIGRILLVELACFSKGYPRFPCTLADVCGIVYESWRVYTRINGNG